MSAQRTRIVYIEDKTAGIVGPARIARVLVSKSGRSVHYRGRTYIKTAGYKYNHIDVETGARFWISGPKARGGDSLYGSKLIDIDEDVRAEYWANVRGSPERIGEPRYIG